MIKIYGNFTDSSINIDSLINKLKNKEIEFTFISELSDNNKLSQSDYSKIFFATQNPLEGCTNCGCPLPSEKLPR